MLAQRVVPGGPGPAASLPLEGANMATPRSLRSGTGRLELADEFGVEIRAGHDGVDPPGGGDRDDQYAMVKEDLGELGIGVLVLDGDWSIVRYSADRLAAAPQPAVDRVVDRPLDHRALRRARHVTGKQRGHELALTEDSGKAPV